MALLESKQVTKRFGGLTAVSKFDFELDKGAIVSIIGPNGAGKTTFFNTLTGIYKPEEGSIVFDGHSLVGKRPDQIANLHISRTFQNIRLFGSMTVIENILVGMFTRLRQNPVGTIFHSSGFKRDEERAKAKAFELMDFVGLEGVGNELGRNLPYGKQRRVEIARALASDPNLLLLDEPTAGMNPREKDETVALIRRVRDKLGITILLIEHDKIGRAHV
jgi:branched-chain amino acid transport system ATP-binding protein